MPSWTASLTWLLFIFVAPALSRSDDDRPQIFVHYMPWFEAPPQSSQWGWHWTMGSARPDNPWTEPPKIASHFSPLIGLYDSSDPAVIEYHLLTMKLAGIDGVIVDWYGLQDYRDYAMLHRNTLALVEGLKRIGLKFAICYEDQTVPLLIEAGQLDPQKRVEHVKAEVEWMETNWFVLPNYLKIEHKPALLSFGQNGLNDKEWEQVLGPLDPPIAYFSLHDKRRAALGAFDWPLPKNALISKDEFTQRAKAWPVHIPVAFPRFVDYYAQANVGPSYGHCPDEKGKTFRDTFVASIQTHQPVIQIATWNDWGEGTQIEPSVEFQFRDLEVIQAFRRNNNPDQFTFAASDLEYPYQLLLLRRQAVSSANLDLISSLLAQGQVKQAASALKKLQSHQ